jgi:hypothetical protein
MKSRAQDSFQCRECSQQAPSGFSLCNNCFLKRPVCNLCGIFHVGRTRDKFHFNSLCARCKCKSADCQNAWSEGGYCTQCNTNYALGRDCISCGQEKVVGSFKICRSCYNQAPPCKCGKKVGVNSADGTFYSFCGKCRCGISGCTNSAVSEEIGYCQICFDKMTCQKCGAWKSMYNDEIDCFKCLKLQTHLPCTSGRGCDGLVGLKKNGEHYSFCFKCACKNKQCENLALDNSEYCDDCTPITKVKCSAENCWKKIPEAFEYCFVCEREYKMGRILCTTPGCQMYKSLKHPYPTCKQCSTKRMKI